MDLVVDEAVELKGEGAVAEGADADTEEGLTAVDFFEGDDDRLGGGAGGGEAGVERFDRAGGDGEVEGVEGAVDGDGPAGGVGVEEHAELAVLVNGLALGGGDVEITPDQEGGGGEGEEEGEEKGGFAHKMKIGGTRVSVSWFRGMFYQGGEGRGWEKRWRRGWGAVGWTGESSGIESRRGGAGGTKGSGALWGGARGGGAGFGGFGDGFDLLGGAK